MMNNGISAARLQCSEQCHSFSIQITSVSEKANMVDLDAKLVLILFFLNNAMNSQIQNLVYP